MIAFDRAATARGGIWRNASLEASFQHSRHFESPSVEKVSPSLWTSGATVRKHWAPGWHAVRTSPVWR
jgi:hypothetical protein